MTDSVTAVIVTYFTGPSLKSCLYILLDEPKVESIIIVNNGMAKPQKEWAEDFAARHASVKLMSGHGNIGFGAGVNLGAEQAQTPYLLVINPDALLVRGSVSVMVNAAKQNPNAGIIGGHLFDSEGKACRGSRRNAPKWLDVFKLRQWEFHASPKPQTTTPTEVISGAFFLVRKTVFDALSGFDTRFFLHFEDIDLCVRANAAGFPTLFCPNANALHYGSTSVAKKALIQKYKAKSFGTFFRKHAKTPVDHIQNFVFLRPVQAVLHVFGSLRRLQR